MEATGHTNRQGSSKGRDDYDLRLMALVHHLVRKEGRMYASARLGVDSRTLASCLSKGRLTDKMRGAAELMLASGDNPALVELRAGLKALEGRLDLLEGKVAEGKSDTEAKLAALNEEQDGRVLELEGWLESLEDGYVRWSTGADLQQRSRGQEAKGERKYPDLVTIEPAPDDEEVLGKAWPLVSEWRWLGRTHPEDGGSLAWLFAEERRLVLELDIMKKYGLTLPPATHPWTGILRDIDFTQRREALSHVRLSRRRKQVLRSARRILTLGRWWE